MNYIQSIFVAILCAIGLASICQCNSEADELVKKTEKLDLITLLATQPTTMTPTNVTSQNTNLKPSSSNRCKNGSSRRCQKQKEREKQANSLNEIWNDADMLQHPIDEEPRRIDRTLGEMCLYSSDCTSGCCMLDRETKIRSCQPKAIQGEKCTTAQIKADLYVDVCPCEAGDSYCVFPGEFCSK